MRFLPFLFMMSLVAVPALAESVPVTSPTGQNALEAARRADPGMELKKLQDGLPAKKKELEQLRRKWTIVKGRVPSAKEISAFEKKQAKGEAGAEDNPYINKNPPGTPGKAREAYYLKLDEVRQDEERIDRLRKELDTLSR